MKTKHIFYSMALALIASWAYIESGAAQVAVVEAEEVSVTEVVPGKVHYYSPKVGNNWYISLGAGAQTFLTEHKGDAQYTLAMSFALGKWITPYVGIRINAMGGSLHSLWPDKTHMFHTRYAAVYGDLMWDLTNALGGYNERRVVSVIPFAGVGGIYGFHNPEANRKTYGFPVSIGMKINFRLGHYVDFFLEGRANAMTDQFNGVIQGRQIESIVSAIGGLTVKFGKERFVAYDAYADRMVINGLNNRVNELRSQLEVCESRECPPCPEQEVVVQEVIAEVPQNCNTDLAAVVRFRINSAVVSNEEMVNVYNIAQWMKKNPDCNVMVSGYADKETGTPAYNLSLSKKRAEAVVKILTSKYGINANRIHMEGMGSNKQPYPNNNNWNRVVIFSGKAAK
ncbi:OmpA family protein [Coprobacter tertius]|uniref:OmpA family protein n=1 Tax=Coprobacter tertius TaxID=2944915 RepID=A0ABT1MJ49_9BACT|nr:OmpA family protein [Coprobacter tertius]MCP9611271.1 OmpA family protein [Coprobacter tertius]